MEALSYLQLSNNIALCGGTPPWRTGTALHLANTNLHQSCLLTQASGLVVGVVFGALTGGGGVLGAVARSFAHSFGV